MSFWWIDWQQGGNAGGMTSYKQNPTIWLAHLRCTDRHRSVSKSMFKMCHLCVTYECRAANTREYLFEYHGTTVAVFQVCSPKCAC